MGPKGTRQLQIRLFAMITRRLNFYRPACVLINTCGPVHIDKIIGRNEFPGFAVNDIEKAVFGRLHNNFTGLAFDLQIRQDKMLGRRIVPGFARGCLVVPNIFARIRPNSHD